MRQAIAQTILLTALLTGAPAAFASADKTPPPLIGTLTCKILPHSGISLMVHSTRDILCKFKPRREGPVEYYKGETGIEFGIDINFDKRASLKYVVRAPRFIPGSGQLAGKYTGVGGSATFGLTLGNSAPISKQDGNVSLQPVGDKSSGGGFAAGFTYIYLEAGTQKDWQKSAGQH